MKRHQLCIVISSVFWGLIHVPVSAEDLPRYKLSVGQEIQYKTTYDFTYQSGAFHDLVQWTAWVTDKNDDGSAHVVLRTTTKHQQIRSGKPAGTDEPNVEFMHFDLFADGRCAHSSPALMEPSRIFPMLPERSADKSWDQEIAFARIHYTPAADAQAHHEFVFHSERQSPEAAICLITDTGTIHFDASRGLMTEMQTRYSQGYGFKGTGQAKTSLTSVETHPADWTAKFGQESQAYFAAAETYWHHLDQMVKEPGQTDALLSQARQHLLDARKEITLPDLAKLMDERISKHARAVSDIKEEAQQRAAVLNHPAADWSLKDLADKTHSLSDYRGKIVLLDFWYRGCGWCMRAMPQIKQVVSDFKDEPVVVLGMNTDRDPQDAKFVVDKMGLNYEVLRADQDLPKGYDVQGFPTLIIIDQKGIVRDIHVGYSPDLREKVEQSVRRLLPKATE